MANAIRGRGAAYDVQPSGETAYGGPIGGLIGFFMDAMRGACSGLLTLLGGMHMTGTAQSVMPTGNGFESLAGVLQQMSMNGLAGPVEIIGGIVLFLTTRRAIARMLGLLAFIGFAVALANGYSLADMLAFLSTLFSGAAGVLEQAALNSAV